MSEVTLKGFVRKSEQAASLGLSTRLLNKWMLQRKIPYYKIGRTVLFKPSEVEAALKKFRINETGKLN